MSVLPVCLALGSHHSIRLQCGRMALCWSQLIMPHTISCRNVAGCLLQAPGHNPKWDSRWPRFIANTSGNVLNSVRLAVLAAWLKGWKCQLIGPSGVKCLNKCVCVTIKLGELVQNQFIKWVQQRLQGLIPKNGWNSLFYMFYSGAVKADSTPDWPNLKRCFLNPTSIFFFW